MTDPIHIRKDTSGVWHAKALRLHMDMAEPGQYAVTFKRTSGRKSQPQNGYLHVLFGVIADTLNAEGMGNGDKWTKDTVKEWMKAQGCYPSTVMHLREMPVMVPKRTRDLTKDEASEVIENVLRYWAEFGIVLPNPGEQMELT